MRSVTMYVQIAADARSYWISPRIVSMTRKRPTVRNRQPGALLVTVRIEIPDGLLKLPEPVVELVLDERSVERVTAEIVAPGGSA